MNPQAQILNKAGLLNTLILCIEIFLISNSGKAFSSNEILLNLPSSITTPLNQIASRYHQGACGKASSYVGTSAAMLAMSNPNIVHHIHYKCSILNRFEDAFEKI